jgi:hypothetical protein
MLTAAAALGTLILIGLFVDSLRAGPTERVAGPPRSGRAVAQFRVAVRWPLQQGSGWFLLEVGAEEREEYVAGDPPHAPWVDAGRGKHRPDGTPRRQRQQPHIHETHMSCPWTCMV